jgi:signal transduction histidine kinase
MTIAKNKNSGLRSPLLLLNNPHFWILFLLTSFLVLIYQFWPWRDYQFQGYWQWLAWLSPLGKLAIFEGLSRLIGSLFIIPCIYASIVFQFRGSLVLSLISLVTLFPLMLSMWKTTEPWIANIVYLFMPVILTTIINVELRLRTREKKFYVQLEKERRMHLAKIVEAQEKAQQRIAREIHDESIQTLLATASHIERLKYIDNIDEIKAKTIWIEKNIRSTAEELRRICRDLRPAVLDDLGLVSALRWLIQQPILKDSLPIQIIINGDEVKLGPDVELTVFRVVQEALNNVKAHAKATEAVITLKYATDFLTISIQDNGHGFELPRRLTSFALKGKLGLIGIQERIQSLNGKSMIKSNRKTGTEILIEIPISTLSNT